MTSFAIAGIRMRVGSHDNGQVLESIRDNRVVLPARRAGREATPEQAALGALRVPVRRDSARGRVVEVEAVDRAPDRRTGTAGD